MLAAEGNSSCTFAADDDVEAEEATRGMKPISTSTRCKHITRGSFTETILASAARRIKKLVDSGLEPYDAFNVVQHQMIDVAQAYLERIVLEQFQEAIKTVEDEKSKEILTKLYQLYALSQIEKNKAWYLEDGYMEAVKTKAVRKIVNQLCWDIRPDAVALVNAFDIPESCLAAPIAVN